MATPPPTHSLKLNSGYEMPFVGYGTYQIPKDVCPDTVYNASKAGYRLLDGACEYGNELEVSLGVSCAINEGLVTRSELFIVSKLWNTFHDPERVSPICKRQLQDWGIDYFDLYLIHFPIAYEYVDPAVKYPPKFYSKPSKVSIQQTWMAIEGLTRDGLTRSIGFATSMDN